MQDSCYERKGYMRYVSLSGWVSRGSRSDPPTEVSQASVKPTELENPALQPEMSSMAGVAGRNESRTRFCSCAGAQRPLPPPTANFSHEFSCISSAAYFMCPTRCTRKPTNPINCGVKLISKFKSGKMKDRLTAALLVAALTTRVTSASCFR